MLRTHACRMHWHHDRWARTHLLVTTTSVPPFPWMQPIRCADPDDLQRPRSNRA